MSSNDEIEPEYNFDYSSAKPNRFADAEGRTLVALDEDLAKIFTTDKLVNKALRSLIEAIPKDSSAA